MRSIIHTPFNNQLVSRSAMAAHPPSQGLFPLRSLYTLVMATFSGFDYKRESWANATEMISRAGHDLHHIIPKHILLRLQKLGIKPGLDLDATPGHLMDKAVHQKITSGMAKTLTSKSLDEMNAPDMIKALANFYDDIGENAQAKIVRSIFD